MAEPKSTGTTCACRPSHIVHACVYPRLHSQAVWRPCGAAMGWALATHGPRGYFYALVMQLHLRSTVVCVEVTSTHTTVERRCSYIKRNGDKTWM